MKKLDHPALPRIVDIFEEEKHCAVVMDYIPGASLAEILKTRGAIREELAMDWMRQLADVLCYLHTQNPPILYLDLKPSNVILRPDGRLALLDLGAALELDPDVRSRPGEFCTPAYAAPEQIRGACVDARSDLYSLGMMILEMLTGIPPGDPADAPPRVKEERKLLRLGGVSRASRKILKGCLATRPEERYRSCGELIRILDQRKRQSRKKGVENKGSFVLALMASLLILVAAGWISEGKWPAYAGPGHVVESRLIRAETALAEGRQSLFREGEESFRERVLAATPCFREALELLDPLAPAGNERLDNEAPEETESEREKIRELAESYVRLCDFYTCYMFANQGLQQPRDTDYGKLLQAVEVCIKDTVTPETEDGAHVRLLLLENLLNLVREYRQGFALSGIPKERPMEVVEQIETEACSIRVVRASLSEQRDQLLMDCEDCRERIEDSYDSIQRWRKAEE